MTQPMGTACVLTNGKLDQPEAKTAHGMIRGTERFVIQGVIDHNHGGGDAGEIIDGTCRGIPVYRSIRELIRETGQKPDYAVVGVAISGGRLNNAWQALLLEIIDEGVSIVNGLHMLLSDIPEFRQAAERAGVELLDIRRPKPFDSLGSWSGDIYDAVIPRLAVLGTDCALGKRTTAGMLIRQCLDSDIAAEMIYTGQTGWLQGYRYGFIFDATLNDFVSSEVETAILTCEKEACPDLIVIEGQSALRNPLGPAGAEIIISGNVKGVILQHAPFRTYFDDLEDTGCVLPDIASEIRLLEMYGTKVIAVTLNGQGGSETELSDYAARLEAQEGIPVISPLEEGVDRLIPLIREFMTAHPHLPDVTRIRKP